MRQLIEDEKIAQIRKRIRQEIAKALKDEEKTRKDIAQRSIKGLHDLIERCKSEKQRIVKELAERERREQLEHQREQEIIKQAQEQNAEMKRRIEEMKHNITTLLRDKKELGQEIKELRKANEKYTNELNSVTEKKTALEQKVMQHVGKIAESEQRLNELRQGDTPASSPSRAASETAEAIDVVHLRDLLKRIA
ncbi:unnamed protein product [Trypanosoma congolense IL3000]|uniref:WGS project CAEQ00000000 data, annotated contig 2203 n=1 Tax=Trypanosoma congolense (strain IL3000) TaxID=1068625 RepID=F9WC99_TRYCI|nr:unnamed protein product [Trypanosoma congolense IL3000]